MSSGLRAIWGLEESLAPSNSTAQGEQFRAAFSKMMEGIGINLEISAAHAAPAVLQEINGQREALYAAYHKVLEQIDPADPSKAAPSIQRVLAATTTMQKRTTALAQQAIMGCEEWRAREAEFDSMEDKIDGLEEAGHPKAGVLRKIADSIRTKANEREYDDSLEALDQLAPKLSAIYQEHTEDDGDQMEDFSVPDINDLSRELAVAESFVTLWNNTLEEVAEQVEVLRNAMQDNSSPRVRSIYDGLATVMKKFPDLDLSQLVDTARANDRQAYNETLKQSRREVKQVRDLLANGPLLSTIDQNPFYKTNVHATVKQTLDIIAQVLRV